MREKKRRRIRGKRKKIKSRATSKQINQIQSLSLSLEKLNGRVINKHMSRLRKMSLRKSGSFIFQSLNKAYGNYKEKQINKRLKQIKFEKKEKTRRIKKKGQERKRLDLINKKRREKERKRRLKEAKKRRLRNREKQRLKEKK